MSAIGTTLELYRDSAVSAGRGALRSPWPIVYLVGAHMLMTVVQDSIYRPLAAGNPGNGFLLGLFVSLLHAGVVGLYLHLVELTVRQRRTVRWSDLQDNLGVYLWEVISVLFIFFIAELLLMPMGGLGFAVLAIASIVFNPMPEQIYQDHTQSLALLADGADFMQRNWPEWLGAHLLAAAVLTGIDTLVGGGWSPALGLWLVQLFGPYCGFIDAARLAFDTATTGLVGVAYGAFLLGFVHFFMLFRGHLYHGLAHSNRRAREWARRMGE